MIVQPVTGDIERGESDANDDDALESESADEALFESMFLNKGNQLFIVII